MIILQCIATAIYLQDLIYLPMGSYVRADGDSEQAG